MGGIVGGLTGGGGGKKGAKKANALNERAIDEVRRQFDLSREDLKEVQRLFDPFVEAGTGQLPALLQGATTGGLDERLAEITNTDIFGTLVGERSRAVQGQLASTGLTRSGTALQEISAIPTNLALDIENQLFGRQSQIAGSGQNAIAGQGGIVNNIGSLGQGASSSIANLLSQSGANLAAGGQADTNTLLQLLGLGGAFFGGRPSDPRLKKNAEQIGSIRDLGLSQWDWVDEAKGTIIEKFGTIGFMADEVEEKYPHHVGEFGGWKVINYDGLLDELQEQIWAEAA